MGAAAAHQQLLRGEIPQCVTDAAGSQLGQGGLNLLWFTVARKVLCQPVPMEKLAAGAFGGRQTEEGIIQQLCQQRRVWLAASGPVTVAIERLLAVLLDPVIHQYIARAAIEAAQQGVAVQKGHVGHATDVGNGAALAGAGKQLLVERRDQGCPLAAQRHVLIAEVAHHADAGFHRQGIRAAQLQAEATFAGPVAYGLAVAANGAYLLGLQAGLFQQGLAGLCIAQGELAADGAGPVNFVVARLAEGQYRVLQGVGQRLVKGSLQGEMSVTDPGQHRVDAIHAGAGHQANQVIARGVRGHRCLPGLRPRRTGSSGP